MTLEISAASIKHPADLSKCEAMSFQAQQSCTTDFGLNSNNGQVPASINVGSSEPPRIAQCRFEVPHESPVLSTRTGAPVDTFLRPFEELDALCVQTRQRVHQIGEERSNGSLLGNKDSFHAEFMELMDLQMRMTGAAMSVELVAKTIEVGTSGINTLSRTQT